MLTARSSYALFALMLVAGACGTTDDLSAAPACGPNGECPQGYSCDQKTQLCLLNGQGGADAGSADGRAPVPDAPVAPDASSPDAPPSPAALSIGPRTQDFGMLTVGQAGQPLTFSVENTGGLPTGAITASVDDTTTFSLAGGTCSEAPLAPGGRCTVLVAFHPTSTAPVSATLTVTAGPGGTSTATLTGGGLTPGALQLTGTGSFGRQPLGTPTSPIDFTLRNTGGSPTGPLAIGLTDGGSFSIAANDCPSSLPAGASCAIGVSFTPAAIGVVQGVSLTVAATPGGAVATDLSGTGTAEVQLTIQGSGSVASTPPALACASSCTVVFDSAPVHLAAKPSATFTFGSWSDACSGNGACDLALTSALVQVTARFDVIPASLTVTPKSQAYGSIALGGSSDIVPFTVKNVGGATTGALAVAVDDDAYQVAGDCAGAKLAAGKTCTVSIAFAPTGAAGDRPATLTVSGTPGGDATASLTGTALVPGALDLSPGSQTFGSQTLGVATDATTFTVTNKGETPTGPPVPTLSDTTHFQIAGTTCAAALEPAGTCTVDVVFKPAAVGPVQGVSLVVAAVPGGNVTAPVSGTGTADIALKNAGGGTVRSTPDGMNCSADCTVTFATTPVDLTAMPDGLHTFGGWSGVCSGTAGCHVDLVAASNAVTAKFDLKPAAVGLAPGNQGFGSVVLGGSSAKIAFTASNTGGIATGTLAAATGDPSFTISEDLCSGKKLDPGASCTLNVAFTPSGQAGAKQATLTVSATPGGAATSSLTGTALTPGALEVTPPTVTFAATRIGSTSAATELTVKNTGGAPTGVPGISLSDATHFTITSNLCTTALAAGATCKVKVAFAPVTVGLKQGVTLNASATPGGTASSGLTGTGTAQVTVANPVGGTVTSDSMTINCGPTCFADFSASPTLTARPDATHTFGGWSGAGCSGTTTCQPTLTAPTQTVTAMFNEIPPCQFVTVDTFAGDGQRLSIDGQGLHSSFTIPDGLTVDGNGVLYVQDLGSVRKILPDATVSTLLPLFPPLADNIVTDGAGNIYQAAEAFSQSFVEKLTLTPGGPNDYTALTLTGGIEGFMDGPAGMAKFQFNLPGGGPADLGLNKTADLLIARDGSLFVSDSANRRIRRVTLDGTASTIAGDGTTGSGVVGPSGMTLDTSGRLVFADMAGHAIRRIEANGTITTIAGTGVAGFKDGPGAQAQFKFPRGVISDAAGNLYVTDFDNERLRKIAPDGMTSTLAGSTTGYSAGATNGCNALFNAPWAMVLRGKTIFLTDRNNMRIRTVVLP